MSAQWYYNRAGQQCGPVTAADLRVLADSGGLQPTDLVCKAGGSQWVPASTVRGLFPGVKGERNSLAMVAIVGVGVVLLALVAGLIVLLIYKGPANQAAADPSTATTALAHPWKLKAALRQMKKARAEVEATNEDFGGRRHDAMQALDKAIEETEATLQAAHVDLKTDDKEFERQEHYPDHPELNHALYAIKEAKAELRDAFGDVKEHRDRTLRQLERAQEEIERALGHDHGDRK